jgi:nucleotide-binding universal stress UspA family protein
MHANSSTEVRTAEPQGPARKAERQDSANAFDRILVPVDFSLESQTAIEMALELRSRFGSEVCLFNLTTVGTNDDFRRGLGANCSTADLERDGKERLRMLVEKVSPGASEGVGLQVYVGDDVARWVHDVASAWPATLVVLSSHPSHTVFRSLAEKIVRALKIPMLILQ